MRRRLGWARCSCASPRPRPISLHATPPRGRTAREKPHAQHTASPPTSAIPCPFYGRMKMHVWRKTGGFLTFLCAREVPRNNCVESRGRRSPRFQELDSLRWRHFRAPNAHLPSRSSSTRCAVGSTTRSQQCVYYLRWQTAQTTRVSTPTFPMLAVPFFLFRPGASVR